MNDEHAMTNDPDRVTDHLDAASPDRATRAELALQELYGRLIDVEREVLVLEDRAARAESELSSERAGRELAEAHLADEHARRVAAEAHIQALESTRLFRWADGPRRIYAALRRRTQP
jgi:hypothetical protein